MKVGDKFKYVGKVYSFIEWWHPGRARGNFAYVNAINEQGYMETLRIPADPIKFPNHNIRIT